MNKLSKIVVFVLVLLLGVLLFQNYLLRRSVQEAVEQGGTLPPGVQQQVTVKQDKVTVKEKETNSVTGEVTVHTQTMYVPPEGQVVITTTDEGKTTVDLTNKGFTFTPGLVFVPSKEMNIGVSARLIYWNRFGAGIGGIISITDDPKPAAIGFVDYRFYKNFAVGVAYREAFTERSVGATLTYYF